MNQFEQTLYRAQLQLEAIRHRDQQVINGVFQEQRDRLLSVYLRGIRIHREIQKRNRLFSDAPILFDIPAFDWLNAAVLILEQADLDTQKFFVSLTNENKNELVEAVLRDGGIYNGDYFVELILL